MAPAAPVAGQSPEAAAGAPQEGERLERRTGQEIDAHHAAVARHLGARLPGALARGEERHHVGSRIYGHGQIPLAASDGHSVAEHFDLRIHAGPLRRNRQPRQKRLERGRPIVRDPFAPLLHQRVSLRLHLAEKGPCARAATLVLQAIGQVKLRPDAGVELQALFQLGTRGGVLPVRDELLRLVEQRLSRGGFVGGCDAWRGQESENERDGGGPGDHGLTCGR